MHGHLHLTPQRCVRSLRAGVGSYERECRTLYVHYGGAGTLPAAQVRQLMDENFKEWGPIEDVYVVPSKTIAFIRQADSSDLELHWLPAFALPLCLMPTRPRTPQVPLALCGRVCQGGHAPADTGGV